MTATRWYRQPWLPWLVALVLVCVVALVAGIGWSRSRQRTTCDPRDVAAKTMASVVTLLVRGADGAQSNGSGEFLDDTHVLTNNHVISSAVAGGTVTVLRPNGERLPARLVGRDNATDLAVVSVQPEADVVPVRFGGTPEIGEQVFAIGAPLGLADSFTAGVVSALNRSVRVPADAGTTALLTSAIQTDASINPGNSGGMLADCAGDLVGVPTAGATASDSAGGQVGGSIGLGFAIPAATAERIAHELVDHGRVQHGDVGMAVAPVSRGGDPVGADALAVTAVTADGPAAEAGLRVGDLITTLDGQPVSSADQLQAVALTRRPGDSVQIGYQRGGQEAAATLVLGGTR